MGAVSDAAENGSRLDLLKAMRARVAEDIDKPETPQRDMASLTRRLLEIADQIASIEAQAELAEDSVAAATAIPDEPFDGTFT